MCYGKRRGRCNAPWRAGQQCVVGWEHNRPGVRGWPAQVVEYELEAVAIAVDDVRAVRQLRQPNRAAEHVREPEVVAPAQPGGGGGGGASVYAIIRSPTH
jgi:hypothetical protein